MDYELIKKCCLQNSAVSEAVIDKFLINYAEEKEKMEPLIAIRIKQYKSVVSELPESYINFMMAEFIAHRIFCKKGFIHKYIDRKEIKSLPPDQYSFIEFQSQHSWRYSFAEIQGQPADEFFEMKDVITGENYLLFSPGMNNVQKESHPRMWFNLIAWNGKCWQTFGLIIPFKAFTLDDLFFFATEINPRIENEEMLQEEIEKNPWPFFMLLSAAEFPVISTRGFESLQCCSADSVENFSSEKLAANHIIEWNKNVYQVKSKRKGEFPHYAIAYYNEKTKELLRTASTKEGFKTLSNALIKAGFFIDPEADIVVSSAMIMAIENILNKEVRLNPYDSLFLKQEPGADKEIEKLNHFLELAIPYYNSKQTLDISKLAEQAGITTQEAEKFWKLMLKNIEKQLKKLNTK